MRHDARDRGNHNDRGGKISMRLLSGLEEREKCNGGEVDRRDVGIEHVSPKN